jgi:hypothetical protein
MKKIVMTKYGFVRWPEEDFSDDGNRFQVYKVGRVRVTKCTSDGEAYIDGDIRDGKLPYDVYSKLPHYPHLGKLNGISIAALTDEDLQELYEDCMSYEAEYAAAEASIKYPTLEEITTQCKLICAKRLIELGTVEDLMKDHGFEAATKFSAYEWKTLQEYLKNLMGKVKQYNPDTYPQSIVGQAYSFNFVRPDNSDFQDCFYYTSIVKMFKKYSII